ncbi:MAG: hypothetical protein CL561_07010 [Alphaproteobacteria bacterium]|nr:hypothetical protein [Alphaproteobacteria bacterium]|tara:strand:+ start:3399 stop:4691 length:1293 start_codon:yes stop_codon:yes gene_type:complete
MGIFSGLTDKITGKSTKTSAPSKNDPARYSDERERAASGSKGERMNLAKNTETHREILYYLAENDPDPKIRRALVQNASLPVQASGVLAKDDDVDVRLALAERLIKLLPELSKDKQSQLYAYAVQALGTLALDEVLKIRLALTSALKDHAYTPPKVAGQLARDVERQVSEPILKFCAALADDDLLDILSKHPASWAIQAIASRSHVSGDVSTAIIRTEDVPAGQMLIENEGAELNKELLMEIVDKARTTPEWQKPTALRKALPYDIVQSMMSFVDEHIKNILESREDFDEETRSEVAEIAKRRVAFATEHQALDGETSLAHVKRLDKKKLLNEELVADALAMRETEFVLAALAHKAKTNEDEIKKIVDMKSAKSIVSLCWHCKFSMRFAFRLEQELCHIPKAELIYPKDGTDFPLPEADMKWQMEFLGFR